MKELKIIVCIKQVPATTDIMIDDDKGTLIRDGVVSETNPFDMYAIEEALQLKEKYGGEITTISMGPPQVEEVLREAIAMGCDHGISLTDTKFAGSDTLATSYTLSCGIRKNGTFDIIFCGLKTTDGDTGQVGPSLAEELNVPHVSYVRKIISIENDVICLERCMDDYSEIVELSLPVLITVIKGTIEPRYPSFKKRRMARERIIPKWTAEDLNGCSERFGLDGSKTRVIKVFHPLPRGKGELLEGNPKELSVHLALKLKKMKLIK
jgi:electron transfer flavoprotein alpha/beta subunit